jgi:pyridoxine 4-dehydrogenase
MTEQANAVNAGTVTIGGDLTVNRLGLGTNRISHNDHSRAVLKEAVARGVQFIDTADMYGMEGHFTSESTIAETLAPYAEGLLIATKGGHTPGWQLNGSPDYLRSALEESLQRLKLDQIDLYYFHRPDPNVPFADSVGALAQARDAGKIRHVGLSNVTIAQIEEAQQIVPIASVQNRYNPVDQSSNEIVSFCEANGIAFVPYSPLGFGNLEAADGVLNEIAGRYGAKPFQIALAWILKRSPVMLPIPGTLSIEHLHSNLAAASIELSDEDFNTLSAL